MCKARNDIGIAMNIPFLGKKHSPISLENTEKKSQNLQNQHRMNNFQGLSKSHGNKNVTYDRISKPVYIVDTVFYIGKEAES